MYYDSRGKQIDTTIALWEEYFLVRIPEHTSRSVEHIKMYGTRLTGDKQADAALSKQWLTIMLNIADMVDYYMQGTPIRVVKYEDTKTIYDYISKHLEAWCSQLKRGINIGNAPIDDLVAMDQFAHEVYEHAVYQFTPENIGSEFMQHINQFASFHPMQMFNFNNLTQKNVERDDKLPERESMADFLKSQWIGRD